MPDTRQRDLLLARYRALRDRAKRIPASQGDKHAIGAMPALNLLAEAFAWLSGSPAAADFVSAESLLTQAEECLEKLEAVRGDTHGE